MISQRCARAVRPGVWHPFEGGAAIDLGAADPILVEHREGAVVAHARTTPWGPGYHERAVEALERLGDALPGGWREVRDGAGYWETRRRTDLCKRFLAWALQLWTDATSGPSGLERGGVLVGLAAEGPLEVPAGLVATATGFKGPAWIQATRVALERALRSRRPDRPARAARDAFLWWSREPDAFDLAQLGRALCATDVIWRPIVGGDDDPDQQAARVRALECFEAALRADPGAPVPHAEMRRLYELTGREGSLEPAAAIGRFWGGYREGWIRLPIGRWTIGVPGWLRGAVAGDGHDVFWDDEMTVHVSVARTTRAKFSPRAEAARLVDRLAPREREHARVEVLESDLTRGYAVVVPAAGRPGDDALIQGLVAHEGDRVGYTVVARSPAAQTLGLRFGRHLRPA